MATDMCQWLSFVYSSTDREHVGGVHRLNNCSVMCCGPEMNLMRLAMSNTVVGEQYCV